MPTPDQWLHAYPLPRNEARVPLQRALGRTRVQLLTQGDSEMSEHAAATAQKLARRCIQDEPIAYILDEHEFYGRMFRVNPDILISRPETGHLVEAVLDRLPPQGRAWDLEAGSGVVAVSTALERLDARVRASDISAAALHTAAQGVAALGADIEFAPDSWFDTDRPSERKSYDIIVSSSSHIEAGDVHLKQGDLRFEPQGALTDFSDGLSCIRALAAGSPAYLKDGGWLLLEHGCGQGAQVRAVLAERDFSRINALPDSARLDKVTLGVFDHGN